VEFPAVLLNTSTGAIESEFHMYVQPQEHPILSEFCTELTGITQNQVDEGVPLNICLSQFLKWIQMIQKEKKITFSTDSQSNSTSEAKACAFVTWTDWDLGVCLHYECKRKQLCKPDILNSWIDLKATYRAFYNRKPKGLNGALQDLGIAFQGREHSGLDDSRNTARLAWKLICDRCVLKITKSLDKAHQKSNLISRILTVNITDKTPLGNKSRPETSKDGTCATKCLPENKHHKSIAGNKVKSNVQTGDQQNTCTDPSADVHVVPSSSSRTEFHAQSQSSSAASTDRFPVPLGLAQPCPSPAPTGLRQGLSIGQPLRTARPSLPVQGSGLVLVSTTIPSVTLSSGDISTSSECLSLLTDWEDVALIPESQYEQNSDSVQLKDDSSTVNPTVLEEETISKQLAVTGSDNQCLEESVAPTEPLRSVYKSPDTTIYNIGTVQCQTSKFSAFKLPSAKGNAVSTLTGNYSTPLEAPKRKPTSPKTCPPAKKQSFHIYQEKTSSFDHSLPLRSSNLPKVSPAVPNSTVNLNESVRAVRGGKSTPPLCNCGRRAKKLSVSNAGPNHGRAFFCCPVGKQGGNKKSCGYFKWECALLKEKSNSLTFNADALTSLGIVSSNTENSSYKKHLCLRPSMRT
ncbi:ERI2 exoribonuclease, partial [Anthoscopus minutus]|nr:ERI2 exoribonuclease [Anthoscopus minutus]